jgi:hypothetical protein
LLTKGLIKAGNTISIHVSPEVVDYVAIDKDDNDKEDEDRDKEVNVKDKEEETKFPTVLSVCATMATR